jgi:hypothetical protein
MENQNTICSIEDLDIKQNSFIVIASKRNSGKTVLTKNLIKYLFDKFEYKFSVIFSDTAGFNGDYDNIFEKEFVFKSEQLDNKVEKLLKIQEKSIKSKKIIHGLIVLDDVKIYKKSKILIDLATKSRHYKLTVICSVQYCKELISSSIRSNIDYLFWSDLNEQALMAVYQSIHVPMNFKKFETYVNEYNTNYQFIFYNSKEANKVKRLCIVKANEFNNLKLEK